VLEHQVRLAAGREPGVEQARDVRVREPREDAALALEAARAVAAHQCEIEQLDRRLPFVAAVAAAGEPDAAHAAVAKARLEGVAAERPAFEALAGREGRAFEEALGSRLRVVPELRLELLRERCVVAADGVETGAARVEVRVEQLVDQGADGLPALPVRIRHDRAP
jgi:hypothetical protein